MHESDQTYGYSDLSWVSPTVTQLVRHMGHECGSALVQGLYEGGKRSVVGHLNENGRFARLGWEGGDGGMWG